MGCGTSAPAVAPVVSPAAKHPPPPRKRSPPARVYTGPVFSASVVLGAQVRLTRQHRSLAKDLGPVEAYFLSLDTVTALLDALEEPQASEDVARSLIILWDSNKRVDELIAPFLRDEVARARDSDTVLRTTSPASRLLAFHARVLGLPYLSAVLRGPIERAYRTNIELDPSRADEPDSVQEGAHQLQALAQELLDAVLASSNELPLEIRRVAVTLRTEVERRFGNDPKRVRSALGAWFVLRFLAPAITQPDLYGVADAVPDAATQRTLILVAKLMQNLANGAPFGSKEDYMRPLDGFLAERMEAFARFLDKLATLPGDTAECAVRPPLALDLLEIARITLWAYVVRARDGIDAALLQRAGQDDQRCEEARVALKRLQHTMPAPLPLPFADAEDPKHSPRRQSNGSGRRASGSGRRASGSGRRASGSTTGSSSFLFARTGSQPRRSSTHTQVRTPPTGARNRSPSGNAGGVSPRIGTRKPSRA